MSDTGNTGGLYRRYASVRTVPNTPLIFFTAVELVLARTSTSFYFYFYDLLHYVAHTQLCNICSAECTPLLFRCSIHEHSISCCYSKASVYYVSARASGEKTEFCGPCFDCRRKGAQDSRFFFLTSTSSCSFYLPWVMDRVLTRICSCG